MSAPPILPETPRARRCILTSPGEAVAAARDLAPRLNALAPDTDHEGGLRRAYVSTQAPRLLTKGTSRTVIRAGADDGASALQRAAGSSTPLTPTSTPPPKPALTDSTRLSSIDCAPVYSKVMRVPRVTLMYAWALLLSSPHFDSAEMRA